jgi:uncharacterized protein (TIGR03000 family)
VPDPNARVFFDDAPTQQQGTDRVFTTPPLDPNKTYSYTVRATWTENGREINRSKDVRVQPGRTAMVDFRAADLRDNSENVPNPREDRRDLRPDDTTKPLNPLDKDRKDNPRIPPNE